MNDNENLNLRYVTINPTRDITNLSNQVVFQHKFSSQTSCKALNNSFFVIEMLVTSPNAIDFFDITVTPTNATCQSITQSPFSALFKNMQFSINDEKIDECQDMAVHVIGMKYLDSNLRTELESMSPLLPFEGRQEYTLRAPNAVAADNVNHAAQTAYVVEHEYYNRRQITNKIIKNLANGWGPTQSRIRFPFTVILGVEFPLFQQMYSKTDPVFNNSKLEVTFNPNVSYTRDFFVGIPDPFPISFQITNFTWRIPVFTTNIPININYNTKFRSIFTYKSVHNTSTYNIQVKSSTDLVMVYFTYAPNSLFTAATDASGTIDQYTAIAGGFTKVTNLRTQPLLNQLQITFNNVSYPQKAYSFETTPNHDLRSCYDTYRRLCGSYTTQDDALLTWQQYMNSPVFLFSVASDQNTTGDSTLTINVNNPIGTHNIVNINVLAWTTKQLSIQYGDSGEIIGQEVGLVL
jgi:hypothetical protein